jgi:uncharacterized membrane protein
MNPTLDHALELTVVGAALCVLLVSFFFEGKAAHLKHLGWIFGALALLSAANFFNFGLGEIRRDGRPVHRHEQFHFFLGSKYLTEVRYDGLYDAALIAALEEGRLRQPEIRRRDLSAYRIVPGPITKERTAEIRGRFTEERWREFRRDTSVFFAWRPPVAYVRDHGNTGSPAWAMTASLFTRPLDYNPVSARVFVCLDVILLLILFATVGWAFGGRVLALTMIVGLSVPLVYTYLGGSILRMDWIVALGLSVCLFEKRHYRTAGLLLGYAVASKLFAGVMVIPLGLRFLADVIRQRRVDRDHLRYVGFAVLGLVVFVLLSAAYFADVDLWRDYSHRILKTFDAKYYQNNHSFRDVFLQAVHRPWSIWNPFPEFPAARDPDVFIGGVRGGFVAAQLLLLVALGVVAVRNPVRVAFALGPLTLFVLLVTNRYYWQVWMISALALAPTYRRDWRHTTFLAAVLCWLGCGHVVRLSSLEADIELGGYFGSFNLVVLGALVIGLELISWCRQRRA